MTEQEINFNALVTQIEKSIDSIKNSNKKFKILSIVIWITIIIVIIVSRIIIVKMIV